MGPQAEKEKLRILVPMTQLVVCGGLLRFERLARQLERLGHELYFCPTSGHKSPYWRGSRPTVDLASARCRDWDATMLPGRAEFDANAESLATLSTFSAPNFGIRFQFVLNDRSLKPGFLAVNQVLKPHYVIFNNPDWDTADFPDFIGNQFHVILGGVECDAFQSIPNSSAPPSEVCWIGGQTRKNVDALIGALRRLPERFAMRLFGDRPAGIENAAGDLISAGRLELVGPIDETALPGYYAKVDLVISPESIAGWSNTSAEALASGRPLICTQAGTRAFAENGETAIVVPSHDASVLAGAVLFLDDHPELWARLAHQGRERIQDYDWGQYADRILALLLASPDAHYYHQPEAGLHGKWSPAQRLSGLSSLFEACAGQTVLDIGSAEGLIAQRCLEGGAAEVDGLEIDPLRVRTAQALTAQFGQRGRFLLVDLETSPHFLQSTALHEQYDLVTYLGVHQHLSYEARMAILPVLIRKCRKQLLVRTPDALFERDRLADLFKSAGFTLIEHHPSPHQGGSLWIYDAAPKATALVSASPSVAPQIISYPKSGRTWIRYALHQLGIEARFRFHHDGFEFNNGSRPEHDFDLPTRLSRYRTAGPIILVERDPRAVIVSLYHQITGRFADFFGFEGQLTDFIRDDYFGAAVLRRFRDMWSRVALLPNVLVVRYEDCHTDMAAVLRRIMTHCRVSVSEDAIMAAAESASAERMRAAEASGKFPEPWLRSRNDSPKVRKARIDSFHDELSHEDLRWLDEMFFGTQFPTPDTTLRQAPVVVLGMHRSGTSVITGCLAALGLDAGEHLQDGNEHNPKGYFEDKRIVAAHDELLEALGSSWDDLRPLPEGWLESPPAAACTRTLRELAVKALGRPKPWLIKDPRMCRLLPLWLRLLEGFDIKPRFVIPVRQPVASAQSLNRRDGIDTDSGCVLWMAHLLDAERHTRSYPRCFVDYEQFLTDWRSAVAKIDKTLEIGLNWSDGNQATVDRLVDQTLDHRDPARSNLTEAMALAQKCHRTLTRSIDPVGDLTKLTPSFEELRYATLTKQMRPATAEPRAGKERKVRAPRQAPDPAMPQHPIGYAEDHAAWEAASAAIEAGNISEGADQLITLVQADTPVWEAFHDLAAIALQQDDIHTALQLLEMAVKKGAVPGKAHLSFATALALAGQRERALETLSPLLRTDPGNFDALNLVRQLLGELGPLPPIAWARLLTDLRIAGNMQA